MKKSKITSRIKVGIFSIIAIGIATVFIFYIGTKRRVFVKAIIVKTEFTNVAGLKSGNAVRFAGVLVGTVESIDIISDTTVSVALRIDREAVKFIKKDSKASISTEGLLGSKYIKITAGRSDQPVTEGDNLLSVEAADMDQLFVSLSKAGNNADSITANINAITKKIANGEGSLGTLISDRKITNQVSNVLNAFEKTGTNANHLTVNLNEMVDTLKTAGNNFVAASQEIKTFSEKLNDNKGTVSKMVGDTVLAKQVEETLSEVENTAEDLRQTSEQVRSNWFVRVFGKKGDKKN